MMTNDGLGSYSSYDQEPLYTERDRNIWERFFCCLLTKSYKKKRLDMWQSKKDALRRAERKRRIDKIFNDKGMRY